MFQSLSGFQVRCNFRGVPARNICSFGFNPYRVFKFAATLVQTKYRRKGRCFNPYRVFKFAATMTVFIAASNFSLSFNPYRVFKFAATFDAVERESSDGGFNPYRVFKFAATLGRSVWGHLMTLFQSLSGFQVRCNFAMMMKESWSQSVSIPIGFSSSLQLREAE